MAIRIPSFTTTCEYTTELTGGYWYIYLKSSGTITFSHAKNMDVFLCGGGGGGAGGANSSGGGGGGGGYSQTAPGKSAAANTPYSIVIGEGGAGAGPYGWHGSQGGETSAFGMTAGGGGGGSGTQNLDSSLQRLGGAGTGYGGAGGYKTDYGGAAGGSGVRAFGTGSVYYGGGGGGGGGWGSNSGAGGASGGGAGGVGTDAAGNGAANTGGGGGGGKGADYEPYGGVGGTGGSGIVILRGAQDDSLPVYFNGTQLEEIYFNGEKLSGLICGGVRLFMQKAKRMIADALGCKMDGVMPA